MSQAVLFSSDRLLTDLRRSSSLPLSIHALEELAVGFLVERSRSLNLLSTFCPLH